MHQMVYDACDQSWHFDVPQRWGLDAWQYPIIPPNLCQGTWCGGNGKIHIPEGQRTERSMINRLSHLELKQPNPG